MPVEIERFSALCNWDVPIVFARLLELILQTSGPAEQQQVTK